jgi:hypothetical protein
LVDLINCIFGWIILFFNSWGLLLGLFFYFFKHLLLLELKLSYLLLFLTILPEIQVKAAASSGLISYDRSRSLRWNSLWFCLCSFNQFLFNINFEFFCNPVRFRTSILSFFGMAHDPYIRIVSILMLSLLRQYKVSLRLHPDLVFVISFFQE